MECSVGFSEVRVAGTWSTDVGRALGECWEWEVMAPTVERSSPATGVRPFVGLALELEMSKAPTEG